VLKLLEVHNKKFIKNKLKFYIKFQLVFLEEGMYNKSDNVGNLLFRNVPGE